MDPPSKAELGIIEIIREKISDLEMKEEDLTDKNLVRFVRARNGDLKAIEHMIRNNYKWNHTEDIKGLLADFEAPPEWLEDFYYGMTGFDREGCPVFITPFGKWDIVKEMSQGNKETFSKHIFHNMERCWTMVKRLSKGEDHMKQVVGIVDLEGLSFRTVTCLDVIELTIRSLKTFEANYPETVKAAVVVNVPWTFQLVWKLIKPFLSERTHGKINFVGGDKEKWREACLKYMDEDQFPEYYGGTAPNSRRFWISRDGTWTCSENQNEEDEDDEFLDFEDDTDEGSIECS